MGAMKEHATASKAVAKKEVQIYNDACDHGYPYNTNKVPKDIQLLIDKVKDLKGSSLIKNREVWGEAVPGGVKGVSITIQIGWEIDEGFECGTEYRISFNKTPKHPSLIDKDCNAFISVDLLPYRKPV